MTDTIRPIRTFDCAYCPDLIAQLPSESPGDFVEKITDHVSAHKIRGEHQRWPTSKDKDRALGRKFA